VVCGLLLVLPLAAGASAQQPIDLDEARQQRDEAATRQERLQAELNDLLSRIEALKVAREDQTDTITRLETRVREQRARARSARQQVADRYREAYKSGASGDALVLLFGGTSPDEVNERAHVLNLLARDSEREREVAEGASAETAALAERLDEATAALAEHEAELDAAQAEAREKVAAAQADVEQADERIAEEEQRREEDRRRRQAEERARREAAAASERAAREARQAAAAEESDDSGDDGSGGGSASGGSSGGGSSGGGSSGGGSSGGGSGGSDGGSASGGGGGSATVSGGIACPVGQPRNYSDTYGAPRSGGRSHMGVDILAPIGTPIYAYEDGTISRMNNSSLGGISLYLEGDSGNLYYYTHLSGYVGGVSAGDRVSAGQHIAHNGDTGNAAGIPHLHWEVRPGGGGNVNPYPYAYRACG
jgi:murein DD-endopeptidase MepM/ murein hydrolase activator NlpD